MSENPDHFWTSSSRQLSFGRFSDDFCLNFQMIFIDQWSKRGQKKEIKQEGGRPTARDDKSSLEKKGKNFRKKLS